eukprot:Hpha_TRINITY_DN13273_c0_g1::TRINITY_DN13273_c0_g1_i1::g.155134::m.155134
MMRSARLLSAAMAARKAGNARLVSAAMAAQKAGKPDLLPLIRQTYGIEEGSSKDIAIRAILEDTVPASEAGPESCVIPPPLGFHFLDAEDAPKPAQTRPKSAAPEGYAAWWRTVPREIKNRVKYDDSDRIVEIMLRERPKVQQYWKYLMKRKMDATVH